MTTLILTRQKQSITHTSWFAWAMAISRMIAYSSTTPIARAAIGSGMNPTTMLLIRYILTTLLLGFILSGCAKRDLNIDRRGMLICMLSGLMGGGTTLTYFWSLTRLNASIASMLVSLYPLIVLGLLSLRGERFDTRQKIRLGLGLAGVYLIIGPHGH